MVQEWENQRSGWEHGKGVVRIGTLFFRDKCLIFLFSVGDLPTVELLFALVLCITYSRLYQTLLEYTGVICYHLYHNKLSLWLIKSLALFSIHWQILLVYIQYLTLEVSLLSKE